MAYVPQQDQKPMGISVFEYILTGRKPYISRKPGKKDINQVAKVINTLQIEDIAMKDINHLSGGQSQMVSIARAIAQEPEVLLLDEPTASLDIRHQVEIMEWLKSFSKDGISIVMALHDINAAMRYANKFIMLKDRSVFAEGGLEIVKKNIKKLYIKANLVQQNKNL